MGQIPVNVIDEIIARCDIQEVISGYIPLKQAGRSFKALCPFHQEKTPSFVVTPDKQIYHCFGCGAGGDVINFVMKYERLEFPEAVELLAGKAGVQLARSPLPDERTRSFTAQLYQLNELAADFYANILKNNRHSQVARDYLKKRRLNEDIIAEFRIGYALSGWEGFRQFAAAKGVKADILEKSGLTVSGKEGRSYDRFRDRIIFPVFDAQGKVAGLGARVLDDSLPKYINSPETLVYHKGKILYGLSHAKEYIRKEDYAVIVEGYVDLLTPYQNGVRNLVASSGTALTNEQARLLKRYTHNVVIIYDADAAGEMAALRGLDILVEEGMNVKIASLPKGYDPDLFARERGAAEFLELIKTAKNIFDYKLGTLFSKYNIKIVEDKAKIAEQMLVTIKKMESAVLQSGYVRKLAGALSISEDSLCQEMKKIRPDASSAIDAAPAGISGKPEIHLAEKILITLMFKDKPAREEILQRLNKEELHSLEVREIIETISGLSGEESELTPAKVFNNLNHEDARQLFSKILAGDYGILDVRRNIDDCIKHIRRKNIKKRCESLKKQMQQAENDSMHQQFSLLLKEYNCLLKERP